ncbi:MAG: hypothetical protein JWM99_2834, partial [Verrucomicrobiales bacterium]|nr:hypothetical protein [Verrucomicrobiales bacterium]
SVRIPYSEDAQPNFAYFVYDGVPSWRGATHPGDADQTKAQVTDYSSNVMSRLPAYHLITKAQSVLDSQFLQRNSGNQFKWTGTIVSDGKVYDHISYRPRGGVWRYAMGKNAWKWSFTHNHHFEMRDNYDHAYSSPHSKLNIRPLIQQGDYLHRGEQGMFESVTLRMFNMLGVPGSRTTWFQFRIIDDAAESGPSQYDGDFWGLYLAVEEGDSDFLKEHDLPDGNFYMMRNSFGDKQNQGRTSTPDSSDLSSFINTYKGSPSTSWWRTNLDLQEYYSYRTVLEAVHHYDVDDPPGKNYEYYHNSVTGLWSVHPWDMDLTWADNMYGGGNEPFRDRVAQNSNQPELNIEFKNRIREIRDLLFNTDQMNQLIDEYANIVHGPAGLSITDADRAQWDYNPILVNSSYGVDPNSKGGWGKFYQFNYEQPGISNSFFGAPQLMKKYVVKRMARLDSLSADAARPAKPQITNLSPTTFPINKLSFRASAYIGTATFAGMKWRVGEITPTNSLTFDPFAERKYEVESAWESPEFSAFNSDFTFPSSALKVGHTYRARVKMKDATGRWSNWSDPIEFAAGEVDNLVALTDNLRVTELMYNPAGGSDFEFIELHNQSSSETLNLSGVKFTQGIDYTFTNTTLAPGRYLVLTRAPDRSVFRAFYNLSPDVQVYGPYTGKLDNAGETVTIKTATGSSDLISFLYSNNRGWSIAADGGGHSLVPKDSAIANEPKGSLNYGGNWRPSTLLNGSPGQADPLPQTGIVINEFAANTTYGDPAHPEYDSNDWIELYNSGNAFENFDAMFLSDDVTQLKKWALPSGGLAPGQRIVFDEVTGFHSPTNSGFGLNSTGEQLVLSYLPGNANDQILDAFSFKAQEPGFSLSRLPDGGPFWFATKPTRNLPNSQPIGNILISELMYHPKPTAAQLEDNVADEFVELFNPTPAPINLFNNVGTWNLDGGVNFVFPTNVVLNAGKAMLVVNFNPTNTSALNAFKQTFGITNNDVAIVGPYTGKLGNSSDKIALEKPQAPSVPGDSIASVIVDEVTYSNLSPWPAGADASGKSITRINPRASGNDPANWNTTTPTPGSYGGTIVTVDTDHDGMPDDWELVHGFDPNNPGDATLDADADGMTNLQEYLASTDPRDSTSRLSLTATASTSNGISLSFKTAPGMGYVIEYATDLGANSWTVFLVVDPQTQAGEVKVSDAPTGLRFYRVRLIQ